MLQLAKLDEEQYTNECSSRQLVMDLDVPALRYLHTASIRLEPLNAVLFQSPPTITVGQRTAAKLQTKYTRQWDAASSRECDGRHPLKFRIKVNASAEDWSISPEEHAVFDALENEKIVFDIKLTPLRSGRLMLPTVEIQPATRNTQNGENVCETDCTSRSQHVKVFGRKAETFTTVEGDKTDALTTDTTMLQSKTMTRPLWD